MKGLAAAALLVAAQTAVAQPAAIDLNQTGYAPGASRVAVVRGAGNML